MTADLPLPERGRWKPMRIGLVDLFLYDAQEFRFRDGRLLIRGDNGSGKSKVLALTLPLLLDASLAPQRVEPDADPGKRMSWNLLQGGEYDERTGYSWIEFGRIDEHGAARFVTLGLGMKAVAGRDQLRHWWFTTSLRMGEGFHLVERTRTVLTRDRLAAALGDLGIVHDTKEAYRRDVDGLLFELGEQRYGALVDLLVHLRQPQLSKRPDERALGAALREALPPLAQDVIDDVAQAFQTLEEDRRQLEDLRASAAAVRAFTSEYADYARVAAARAAHGLRTAQSVVDRAQRAQREAVDAQQAAAALLAAAQTGAAAARDEVVGLRARSEELRDLRSSDAYLQFEQLGRALTAAEREDAAAATELRTAEEALRRAVEQIELEGGAVGTAAVALAATVGSIAAAATAAGVELADADASAAVEAEALRRHEQVGSVRAALGRRTTAEAAAADARRRLDEETARLDTAARSERELERTAETAGRDWLTAVRAALLDAVELRADDDTTLGRLEEAAAWVEEPDGRNPLLTWAADLRQLRATALVEQRVAAEGRRDVARGALGVLDGERRELEAHAAIAPPASPARLADRTGRAGAPFWRCVDFGAGVDDAAKAGLEAALEGAGLLDAWVPPDGGPVEVAGDVVLVPAELSGRTLVDVLVPAGDLPSGRIAALLRSVGLGLDGPAAVAIDTRGRFRAGPAFGAFEKPHATYIGEVARERARAARLAAIAAGTAEAQQQESEAAAAAQAATLRLAMLGRESASLPSDAGVRTSAARLRDAATARVHAGEAVDSATSAVDVAGTALDRAQDDLAWTAADLHLPTDEGSLDAIAEAVRDLLALAPLLADRATALAGARLRLAAAEERAAEAQATRCRRGEEREMRRTALLEATERRTTAEQTVGVEARELDALISAAAEALRAAEGWADGAGRAVNDASRAAGVADGRADDAARSTEKALAERVDATEAFRAFASTGLLRVLVPELEVPDTASAWLPDPSVRLARRIDTPDDDLDPAAWDRVQNRLQGAFDVLTRALSIGGREAFRETRHGLAVVQVQLGPRIVAPDDLVVELETEVAAREGLLTAAEREVLENHLLDEVAATLQGLMHAADRQVAAMNDELESRPTSSGLRIRIVWKPVEDTGLDQARRRLLLRTAAAWSQADRTAIGDFLQHRIQTERAADPEATWHDRLTVALDYRAWNRFVVELHQNGAWRPASGPASGGERVLAASVPLFAAASSHYTSAAPHAPRLILLDEAFAGVDDRSRAKYLGLLATFDLDVVMTSEREWAAYPEVPGIAIANLTRMGDLPAVHVDHWEWDGATRTRAADPGRTAVAEPEPPQGGSAPDLFGEVR